jgi:hypothetical protein
MWYRGLTRGALHAREEVVSVQSEKVTFDCKKLEPKLRIAIGHAHEGEQF